MAANGSPIIDDAPVPTAGRGVVELRLRKLLELALRRLCGGKP
jgi:hypothetical protein